MFSSVNLPLNNCDHVGPNERVSIVEKACKNHIDVFGSRHCTEIEMTSLNK